MPDVEVMSEKAHAESTGYSPHIPLKRNPGDPPLTQQQCNPGLLLIRIDSHDCDRGTAWFAVQVVFARLL